MVVPEYERFDAVGLAKLVRDRQVTPTELLDAAIERVESRNPVINAVVNKLYEEGRRAIAAGLPDGPLRGVPFLLKDIGALMTGAVTTFGARLFADFVADHDSEIVARYRRSGLVIFGKTNTPEFGLAPTTEPRLFGATKNPWNLAYSPGGSSGGGYERGRYDDIDYGELLDLPLSVDDAAWTRSVLESAETRQADGG